MPYRFTADDASVEAGLRRIAREQAEKAIAEIDDPTVDRHETVHQVRKRAKKLRAAVRLVRPALDAYKAENRALRDAARPLSPVRDAQALTEAYDALTAAYDDQIDRRAFGSIRARLTRRRKALDRDTDALDTGLGDMREAMIALTRRLPGWSLDEAGFDAIEGGLAKTYGRAVKAKARAATAPSTESLHEWRKRAKYHWYHARLLREMWPPEMKVHRDAADDLADLLGDDHDLGVLRATLADDPDAFGTARDVQAFVALIDRRRAVLQQRAWALGDRVMAEGPDALARRWRAYWLAWTAERAPAATVPLRAVS
jgi:CHAD domain-containing protein